jgi:hypothetical protein
MIELTDCYRCHWEPLIDSEEAPSPLPEPLPGEGMCPACLARMYREALVDDEALHG